MRDEHAPARASSAGPTSLEVSEMTPSGPPANEPARDARPGDWIEARGLPGHNVTRRGEILEVLGEPGHERYRVRWDERHESVFFPSADGVHVIHPRKRAKR